MKVLALLVSGFCLLTGALVAQPLKLRDPVFLDWARGSSVYNGGGVSVYGGALLVTFNFLAYWTFDNGASLGTDSEGSYNISWVGGSPTAITGKVNGAMETGFFIAGQVADAAPLRIDGSSSFTIGGWYYFPSGTAAKSMMTKLPSGAGSDDYALTWTSSNLTWSVYNTSGSAYTVSTPNITANTWTYVLAWYDLAANTVNIQVNNGSVASTSFSGTPGGSASPGALQIGDGGGSDIGFDELFLSRSVMTLAQKALLWNGGNGNPLSAL